MVYITGILENKKRNKLSSDQKFELLLENFPQAISIFVAIQRAKSSKQRAKERLKKVREKELQLSRSGKEISEAEKLELKIERKEAKKDMSGDIYYLDGSPVMDDDLSFLVRKHCLFRILDLIWLLSRFGFYVSKRIYKEIYPIIVQWLERKKEEYEKAKRNKSEQELDKMTIKELRDVATKTGLTNIHNMKKADLLSTVKKELGFTVTLHNEEESSNIVIDQDQLTQSIIDLSKHMKERKWVQNPFRKE